MKAGASGFLLKDASRDQLAAAVRTVAAGQALLAPAITRRLIEDFCRGPAPGTAAGSAAGHLSERELDVVRAVAQGLSNAEIAAKLYLSRDDRRQPGRRTGLAALAGSLGAAGRDTDAAQHRTHGCAGRAGRRGARRGGGRPAGRLADAGLVAGWRHAPNCAGWPATDRGLAAPPARLIRRARLPGCLSRGALPGRPRGARLRRAVA